MTRFVSTPLLKKLRREATANPKKAGLLGLLLLVAIYFWAPLLRQWIGTSENIAESTAAAGPPAAAISSGSVVMPPATAAAGAAVPKIHWRQMARAIESDPRMRAVEPSEQTIGRDPFVDPQPPSVPRTVAEDEPVVEEATPDELGLVLSSTIVGPSRRTAVINGKIYAPGRELEASEGMVFVVISIEPWGIVLERAGKQFALELPRPSSAAH